MSLTLSNAGTDLPAISTIFEFTLFSPYRPKLETAADVAIAIPTSNQIFLLINMFFYPSLKTNSPAGFQVARRSGKNRQTAAIVKAFLARVNFNYVKETAATHCQWTQRAEKTKAIKDFLPLMVFKRNSRLVGQITLLDCYRLVLGTARLGCCSSRSRAGDELWSQRS